MLSGARRHTWLDHGPRQTTATPFHHIKIAYGTQPLSPEGRSDYELTLSFKKRYIGQIIRGEKTVTRRASRPMVKAGGVYRLRVGFSYLPELIRVRRVYTQRLGDMTAEDALREGAASLEEFRRDWMDIYGFWDGDRRVWVVEFEYLGSDRKL